MSIPMRMVNSVALASGRIRIVWDAHEVVKVLALEVLVESTVPAVSAPSTVNPKAPLTSPSRLP